MPNFKIVRKGYDIYEVDSHIAWLNEELNEFKDKESHINKAIISAEIAASEVKAKADKEYNEIITQAKTQAETILTEAKNESDRLLSKTQNQIALIRRRETDKMNELKLFVEDKIEYLNSFNSDYLNLAKKYFEIPNNEEFEKLRESLKNITALIDSFQTSESDSEKE
ncbi:MAG: DivIVA domain-containing protein [Clostridiales bacterium]|nr:DivIVA domain-containing protein [Clostridiales bacterium]